MFARPQPSSPLSTLAYTNIQTPDHGAPPKAAHVETPSKQGITHHSPAFPPDLGSSSPPMSSPTSYREHPSFYSDVPSAVVGGVGDRSRVRSSAGLFAARARAIQPPLQRSSSTVRASVSASGSSGVYGSVDGHQFRYGPRPGLRKAMTGGVFGDPQGTTTGYALHRPVPARDEGVSRSTTLLVSQALGPPTEESIPGSMWKGKFRKRCLAVSQRKEDRGRAKPNKEALTGRDSLGPEDAVGEDVESDDQAEAEHDEIFRRMIQKEQRRIAHKMAVSFEREVGGSDPAVWEAEVRDAEEAGSTSTVNTPEKPLDSAWQYRSATKPAGMEGGETNDSSFEHGGEEEQLAQFLVEQEREERLLEEYALQMAGGRPTPGGELGLEMAGFTWEDAAGSDEDVAMA